MENAPNQSPRLGFIEHPKCWDLLTQRLWMSKVSLWHCWLNPDFFISDWWICCPKKSGSSHPCFMAEWKANDVLKHAPFSSHLQKDMNVSYWWVLPPTPCNSLKRFTMCCRDRDHLASFLRLGFFGRIQYYSNVFNLGLSSPTNSQLKYKIDIWLVELNISYHDLHINHEFILYIYIIWCEYVNLHPNIVHDRQWKHPAVPYR